MTACTLAHYFLSNMSELLTCGIIQYTRFIIQGTCQHSCERQGDIMVRCRFITPNIIFRTQNSLPGNSIRPGAVKPLWWKCSMEHDHYFMSGTGLCYSMIKIHH